MGCACDKSFFFFLFLPYSKLFCFFSRKVKIIIWNTQSFSVFSSGFFSSDFFLSCRFRRWRRFLFVGGFCPTDFTDIHRFSSSEGFSSDFIDESEGILAYRITHGFSQIFGRWPMAGARSSPLLFFVTQISQMTQIFLRGRALSHRFHRYTQIFYGFSGESLCPLSGGICNDRTGRIRENP